MGSVAPMGMGVPTVVDAGGRTILATWHVSLSDFCMSCSRFERLEAGDYRVCGECGHVYRKPISLLIADNTIRLHCNLPTIAIEDVESITACPLCTHDW
jgi:hypothetical protein